MRIPFTEWDFQNDFGPMLGCRVGESVLRPSACSEEAAVRRLEVPTPPVQSGLLLCYPDRTFWLDGRCLKPITRHVMKMYYNATHPVSDTRTHILAKLAWHRAL